MNLSSSAKIYKTNEVHILFTKQYNFKAQYFLPYFPHFGGKKKKASCWHVCLGVEWKSETRGTEASLWDNHVSGIQLCIPNNAITPHMYLLQRSPDPLGSIHFNLSFWWINLTLLTYRWVLKIHPNYSITDLRIKQIDLSQIKKKSLLIKNKFQ